MAKDGAYQSKDSFEAVTAVILENKDSLFRLAYSYVHNTADAQDIVQDSIWKALSSLHSIKTPASVKPWFYRILINTAIDYIRKNRKYVYLETNMLEINMPETKSSDSDSYQDFDLKQALNKLSTVNKTIIMLRFYEGLELREIAEILNENLNTIKTRLYSSLRKLRIELEEPGKPEKIESGRF